MCASAPLLLSSCSWVYSSLAEEKVTHKKKKKSDTAKASESSLMLIEVKGETVKEMGAVPCSLLVMRKLCRGELGRRQEAG